MRLILLILTMFFLSTSCGCGQRNIEVLLVCKNDTHNEKNIDHNEVIITLNDEMLNGKIKTIYEKRIYNNGIDSLAYFFNELGLLVAEESSVFAGLNKKAIYTYNSDNQRIMTKMYDDNGNQTDYIEFSYDNGNLIKRFYKHAMSTPKITRSIDYDIDTYKYNKNGDMIERKQITKRKNSRNEILQEHIKYQYDSVGNRIVEEKLDLNKIVIERKNNKYNINRKLIETFTWQIFEEEDLYIKDIYEYNEDGTMKLHTHIVYAYGGTNEVSFKRVDDYWLEYEYDHEGRLIKDIKTTTTSITLFNETNASTKEQTCTYGNFDDRGNWQKRTIGNMVIERKIQYY